jgi:steroid delta-isomerase-like uncharacterized protein
MWNQWRVDLIDEIVAPGLEFRGSLGVESRGREGLKAYMHQVRAAFPDFHNHIDQMIVEGSAVAVRLTYTGTHLGAFQGIAPTARRVEYAGAAIFEVADGLIRKGWVLGDLHALLRQLAQDDAR